MTNDKSLPDHYTVYAVRRMGTAEAPQPPGDAVSSGVDADRLGNVIFREEVTQEKVEPALTNCLALARAMIERAANISAGYQVESITLKLALDVEVGLVICDASAQAGIEVEIRRVAEVKQP